ncbi:recombinase RecT [Priestia aryabhattai]|uniref:recombinase RecT n=1 Tax=Priestia aryabhattai TaxID=412384 RepID=UPI002E236A04|nr:recombinase RecT [Priestia aryabhattai]MED4261402.1 recombinase RecT [Priestia aryabhattai]
MATNQSLKNQIASKKDNSQAPASTSAQSLGLKGLLNAPTMQKKFEQVLDKKAPQFMASILNLYNGDLGLQAAEPMSIVSSAMVAASLDLPVDKNLGYAWIVPFYDGKKGHKAAQFQLGYKGYIQLALRTGQYKSINVISVREGELVKWNRLTEEIEFDLNGATSETIIGYCGYFKLINGFEKTVYWTKEELEAHRVKFNKAKDKKSLNNVWKSDYDAMAMKTVLRNLLSKWGILSIEMQKALTEDEEQPERKDITEEIEQTPIDITPEPVAEEDPETKKEKPSIFDGEVIDIKDEDLPFDK